MGNLVFLIGYCVLAAILTFLIIPPYIQMLVHFRMGKQIRSEGLVGKAEEFAKLHAYKTGTPTMGGGVFLIIIAFLVGVSMIFAYWTGLQEYIGYTARYSLFNRNETYLALFTLFTVGAIGCVDDYMNVREIGRTKGLSARVKMISLCIFAGLGALWFFFKLGYTGINIPLVGTLVMGYWYIPVFMFIVVGLANSVNITDGLDGLAGGLLLFNYGLYAFICYDKGLTILSALCMIVVGTLISFLWWNIKPAKFYMGDIGSLSLGATLAVVAMMTDTLFVLLITGSIFFLETISVILQIGSKKLRNGKKIFRIAPFHHHLEAIGWSEETIVMRFWLIGIILTAIGAIVALILR